MKARRMFKNRKYAKTKRDKMDKEMEDLYEANNILLENTKRNNKAILAMREKTKYLQEKALELSKENYKWEQMVEQKRKRNEEMRKRNEEITNIWTMNAAQEILPDLWMIPPNE